MSAPSARTDEFADYDEAPGHRTMSPLMRLVRLAGALSTVFLGAVFGFLCVFGIALRWEVYLSVAFVSSFTIPLIMHFWSEEVWPGDSFRDAAKVMAASTLTWLGEVVLSACIVFAAAKAFGTHL